MATDAATRKAEEAASAAALPDIKIMPPERKADLATIFGLSFALGLIVAAIALGGSDANFFNGPSFMIVILGTMAATSIAYTGAELKHVPGIIGNTVIRKSRKPLQMARQLLDIAVVARKKGLLALAQLEGELSKDPFLARSVQLVADGYNAQDIANLIGQEVDTLAERHSRSASIVRRASEIAPAMGLIGTLVGLVQMLAQLDDPSSIGPAMAVALLTTFYGAILGTIVLAPLAAKLERNSKDETMVKNLVLTAMISIAQQDNPRRLEMLLNSELPPSDQIKYFD